MHKNNTAGQPLPQVSLHDKYDLAQERVLVTGYQAIIRLALMQAARDKAAGHNTAGFISGYRGSPLGGLDLQFFKAKADLRDARVLFQPGLNEDLAATAVWGTQQAEIRGEGKHDGVFSMWYGKGPGVDRCGDVFRHANLAGTAPLGGVLALMGDDHTCESSTTAHQSEFHFVDVMMPVLNPAGVQELLDYGLYGWAMSRFCGVWVGLKCVKDTIESTAVVDGRIDRVQLMPPADFLMPEGGLGIRRVDTPLAQEERLQEHKRDAMLAFLRANALNRMITSGGRNPKIGIATVGKSYLDVRQALDDLGIDEVRANALGLRIWKVACPWPLEPGALRDFARGLDLIMVVEEKRSLIEVQVREELYGTADQPVCIGKKDEEGRWLFPVKGSLDPNDIAIALGERLLRYHPSEELAARLTHLRGVQKVLAETRDLATRIPYFCAGCPHNSSTVVPEGSRAYAGIGCHYMVQWMDRSTEGVTQMGGEGANWIGEAPFSLRGHMFQNLGDGTFNHSGVLAIRAALAAKVNITYKILFNDAVAMTGGQPNEGGLTADKIARIVAAEGVGRIEVVTDEPDKYADDVDWPKGVMVHHRDEIDAVQRSLAQEPGVSVLIYDQTCAAEKRRRRKRGEFPDPDRRVVINEAVCEGCGDCGVQSNCVAVQPVETEFGRKRQIDQTACNKDFSCLKGFCPSFVTVEGGKLKKQSSLQTPTLPSPCEGEGSSMQPSSLNIKGGDLYAGAPSPSQGEGRVGVQQNPVFSLPTPTLPALGAKPWAVIVTGVGGTGVVTVGALIGMAAHLEGKGCGMIDMAGLAQKGGAVYSHVRIAAAPDDIHAIRVEAGAADLVLGCDLVVAGNKKVLAAVRHGATTFVVNTHETYPGNFTRDAAYILPGARIQESIRQAVGAENATFLDATRLATALFGNALAANIFMLGVAWQRGALPLSAEALEQAIALNGEEVVMNTAAFRWGRRAAVEPEAVAALALPAKAEPSRLQTLDEVMARRVDFLTRYQNAAYARRYAERVAEIRAMETVLVPPQTGLAEAVAHGLFKLMAAKDEYEVARLYTDGAFAAQVAGLFEPGYKLSFHLAPPLFAKVDPATGRPRKTTFGPWMMSAFRVLAAMRGVRNTWLDPFRFTAERRMEHRLLSDYERVLDEILAGLRADNHALAVELAQLPMKMRGFGPVRAKNVQAAEEERAVLLERFRHKDGSTPLVQAAE